MEVAAFLLGFNHANSNCSAFAFREFQSRLLGLFSRFKRL